MNKKRQWGIQSIFLSLVITIGMIAMMTGTVYADDGVVPAQNMRWEGMVAKWDPVDGASEYFVYLAKIDEVTGEKTYLNNGGTFGVEQGDNEKDFTSVIEKEGAGKYVFYVGYWMNGTDYYFMDNDSLVLTVENNYHVTFDANGGSGSMDPDGSISGGFALPECTFDAPEGKQFKGWSYTADGEVIADESITLTEDITLYVIWQDKIKVTAIKLIPDNLKIDIKETKKLQVSFEPADAFTDYTWSSTNPNITVQADGTVAVSTNAKDGEEATITVTTTDGLSATCHVTARDYSILLDGNDLRWEGTVAKWDPVEEADEYFVYLFKIDETTGENTYLNSGGPFWVQQGDNEKDFTSVIESNGVGKYAFCVGMWIDGKDRYFMDVESQVLDYNGPHEHSYTRKITKATSTKNGLIQEICNECGDVKSKTVIPKVSSIALSTTTYTYNGNVKSPKLTIKDSKGNVLKNGTDYTVKTPSGRKNVGTYTYKITFKGKYSGTASRSFKIIPAKTSITSVEGATKAFTVKWTKKSQQVTGYRIQYSTSSKFTNPKYATISSYKTTSKKISKLSSKKYYYVRVQTYKIVDGKKYFSAWSAAKRVKTK